MSAEPLHNLSADQGDTRARLRRARDIAFDAVGQLPDSVTRDLNQAMATIANEFHALKCPEAALQDALRLCRHLMIAQSLAGMLDGTYPAGERYS